jgi:ubiquitin C
MLKYSVFIQGSGFKTQIDIDSCDTIRQVKNKIKERLDIDVIEQSLYLGDRQLEDRRTIADCGIEKDEIIRLVRIRSATSSCFQIFCDKGGRSTPIQVKSSYTIKKVKELFREVIGWPVGEQRFIYDGKELENNRVLSDYCITESATLHLVGRLNGGTLLY